MTQYVRGQKGEEASITDFADLVFSQAHHPHDFRTLLPKVYASDPNMARLHYLAKNEDGIRGMVAMLPVTFDVAGQPLRCGMVGTVSVHITARGEGHMKRLMGMLLEDAKAQRLDMLILGGQRQRYQYFGFERACPRMHFEVSKTNLRHTLGEEKSDIRLVKLTNDMEDDIETAYAMYSGLPVCGARTRDWFLTVMHTWHGELYAVKRDAAMIGYVYASFNTDIGEMCLDDMRLAPFVIRALFAANAKEACGIDVPLYRPDLIRALCAFAERWSICDAGMSSILCWERALRAMLCLKTRTHSLQDGRCVLRIDDETLSIAVRGGMPTVAPCNDAPELTLAHTDAQRLLLSSSSFALMMPACLYNWFPVTFSAPVADTF